jgi:hypothetical protein
MAGEIRDADQHHQSPTIRRYDAENPVSTLPLHEVEYVDVVEYEGLFVSVDTIPKKGS